MPKQIISSGECDAHARQQLRQQMRQRRRALSPEQQRQFACQGARRMMAYPPVTQAQTIALFLSFDGELDTRPLIEQLWHAGKQLCLPLLHPFSPGNLLFLHYHRHSKLISNRFNIQQPMLDVRNVVPLQQIDLLIVPLVAFDTRGQRLGMGGGFYDRTLQHWPQQRLPPVGYAHDCQQVAELPTAHWDIPLPAIVTPGRLWQW